MVKQNPHIQVPFEKVTNDEKRKMSNIAKPLFNDRSHRELLGIQYAAVATRPPGQSEADKKIYVELEAYQSLSARSLQEETGLEICSTRFERVKEQNVPNPYKESENLQVGMGDWKITALASIPENDNRAKRAFASGNKPRSGLENVVNIRAPSAKSKFTFNHVKDSKKSPLIFEFIRNQGSDFYKHIAKESNAILANGFEEVLMDEKYYVANANVSEEELEKILERFPSIVRISEDALVDLVEEKFDDGAQNVLITPQSITANPTGLVGVIDSGFDVNNAWAPLIAGATLDKTGTSIVDTADHGTGVAGLAAIGSALDTGIVPTQWNKIIPIKVLENSGRTSITDVIRRIESAVKEAQEDHGCRIFNLSLGSVIPGDWRTPFTFLLDNLSKDLGVLFVCSTGNLDVDTMLGEGLNFPDYYREAEESRSAIRAPADASAALTVGSYTSFSPIPAGATDASMAPKNAPAAHTLRGNIPEFGISKPDVVEEGGSIKIPSPSGPASLDPVRSLRVLTSVAGRDYRFNVGTSFSSPLVAHIAGVIQGQNPIFSNTLIKALILNSARDPRPDWKFKDTNNRNAKTSLIGAGVPSLGNALSSAPNRVTYVYEGNARLDQATVIPFHVPEVFIHANARRRLSVTLCYNPPVNPHVGRYYNEVNLMASIKPPGKNHTMTPCGNSTLGDTSYRSVRHAEFYCKATQRAGLINSGSGDWKLFISPQISPDATDISKFTGRQPFSIVITIEVDDASIDLYKEVEKAWELEVELVKT